PRRIAKSGMLGNVLDALAVDVDFPAVLDAVQEFRAGIDVGRRRRHVGPHGSCSSHGSLSSACVVRRLYVVTPVRGQFATLLVGVTSEEKLRAHPERAKGIAPYRADRRRSGYDWMARTDGNDRPAGAAPQLMQ